MSDHSVSLLDDGPTLDDIGREIGVEICLPEPGDIGLDLAVLIQLYWPALPDECEERGVGAA
jgi:hypothetical protein